MSDFEKTVSVLKAEVARLTERKANYEEQRDAVLKSLEEMGYDPENLGTLIEEVENRVEELTNKAEECMKEARALLSEKAVV
jgi:chromosome segregation ATPase